GATVPPRLRRWAPRSPAAPNRPWRSTSRRVIGRSPLFHPVPVLMGFLLLTPAFAPSPLGGEGLGVRGSPWRYINPLTPIPLPQGDRGFKNHRLARPLNADT